MAETKPNNTYSGLQDNIRDLEMPEIETWQNQYPDKEYEISISTPEFTAICPKTGLPDIAVISIVYIPFEKCIELKSLKEYFYAYRDVGIFHEHVANKILDDLVNALEPRHASIVVDMNVRGGIKTIVSASYAAENESPRLLPHTRSTQGSQIGNHSHMI